MLLFLIGYMGCGKSTIGRKLSAQLGYSLVDTDGMIEQREGCSISEIFERHGEEYFRAAERALLDELLLKSDDCVVSTGGGLPLYGDNMERMNSTATTIYLHRTAENIASRLSPSGRAKRPKLRGLSDEELVEFMSRNIAERDAVYRRAKIVIESNPFSDSDIIEIITEQISK